MNNNESKTLYAITSCEDYGENYHICAITSDPIRAEQLRKYYTEYEADVKIEKFIDGDPESNVAENLRPIWYVTCDRHSYGTLVAKIGTYISGEYEESCDADEDGFVAYIDTENEEDAIKKAQKMYKDLGYDDDEY